MYRVSSRKELLTELWTTLKKCFNWALDKVSAFCMVYYLKLVMTIGFYEEPSKQGGARKKVDFLVLCFLNLLRKLHNFFWVGHWKSRYAKYWQYLCVYFCICIIREKWWKGICALEGWRLTTGTQLSSSSYRFTTFLWHLAPTNASSECF